MSHETSASRKDAHLKLAGSGAGRFRETGALWEEVTLVHQALPERALSEVELGTSLFGHRLRAPILIGAMTGGTPETATVNRALAALAQDLGLGLCLGSQRPMAEDPTLKDGYCLRDAAPDALILGNLGVLQAGALGTKAVAELVETVGADGLMVHLNPAQELVQAGGDRDFSGGLRTIQSLVEALPVPVVVKETGCGLSREAARALHEAGVEWVDVAGAGGTSWPRIEALRDPSRAWLDPVLGEWGIPTAGSLLLTDGLGLHRIAGGGVRGAGDIARALALGAVAVSLAQPVLSRLQNEGPETARLFLEQCIEGLAMICLLTGSASAAELNQIPRLLGPRLLAYRALARGHDPS